LLDFIFIKIKAAYLTLVM